jgi:hypothetical protein
MCKKIITRLWGGRGGPKTTERGCGGERGRAPSTFFYLFFLLLSLRAWKREEGVTVLNCCWAAVMSCNWRGRGEEEEEA